MDAALEKTYRLSGPVACVRTSLHDSVEDSSTDSNRTKKDSWSDVVLLIVTLYRTVAFFFEQVRSLRFRTSPMPNRFCCAADANQPMDHFT
jgi:hypothetical protein